MRRVVSVAVLAFAVAASLATSAPRSVRRFPSWRAEPREQVVAGANVKAWVSRSGREGIGVSVEIDPGETGLSFDIDPSDTSLRIGGRRIGPRRVVAAPALPGVQRLYVVFAFDGRGQWNTGHRRARLRLAIRAPGVARAVDVWLTHSLESPHTNLSDEPTTNTTTRKVVAQ